LYVDEELDIYESTKLTSIIANNNIHIWLGQVTTSYSYTDL